MAYNFKRLSDVDIVTETPESANVLAEVDGEIKRVPATGFGGGGNEADLVIRCEKELASSSDVTTDDFVITSGSVDAVWSAIRENRAPVVRIECATYNNSNYQGINHNYYPVVVYYGSELKMVFNTYMPYYPAGGIYFITLTTYENAISGFDKKQIQCQS